MEMDTEMTKYVSQPMGWAGDKTWKTGMEGKASRPTYPISEEEKRKAKCFAEEVRKGNKEAFYDPKHSPVSICLALTASWNSLRRWRQLARALTEDTLREELAAFWTEIQSGEDVRSRGAALNARLGRLAGI